MVFFKDLIRDLLDQGHTVDIMCNESSFPVPECYREWKCEIYHHDCSRSPLSRGNGKAISQIKMLVQKNQYDIVHCHTPVAAMCTRLACIGARKRGTKVFYTAHGFHFFKGAPMQNWLLYYPVEKICSYFTDVLITINREDYQLAQRKMKATRIEYVPGVGVDVDKFRNTRVDRKQKRAELGIPEDAVLLLSVGELHERKNHEVIIRALARVHNPNIHYAIAGTGAKKEYLLKLADDLGVGAQVHLLGYRKDIAELNYSADICCFPSCKEGLGLGAIEAMACGLPLISSNVQGINDYSIDGVTGYKCDPLDVEGYSNAIIKLAGDCSLRTKMGRENMLFVKKYDVMQINALLKRVYGI